MSHTKHALACGHPKSFMLKSAETGEDLYCEYCDCIRARKDAEQCEVDLTIENIALKSAHAIAIAEVECLWMAVMNHCSAETIRAIEAELEAK